MAKRRASARARMLIPLFIGFLVMAIAFIAISYIQFKTIRSMIASTTPMG